MPSSLRKVVRRAMPHSMYRRYRKRKVASLIATYAAHDVTHVYGKHTLQVRLADPLAQGWYDHDWEEWTVIGLLRDRGVLVPGATVFDLGAHQAILALMLAREVGDEGHVVAVEAEPHNARIATVNRELNSAQNLTVSHAAAGEAEGFASFAEGLNGHIDPRTASGNVVVPVVTVDGLAKDFGIPDLVFIDVEGYEGHVLRGASAALANGSTSFGVEVHETITDFDGSAQAVADCFLGFDMYITFHDDEPFVPLQGPPPAPPFFLVAIPAA